MIVTLTGKTDACRTGSLYSAHYSDLGRRNIWYRADTDRVDGEGKSGAIADGGKLPGRLDPYWHLKGMKQTPLTTWATLSPIRAEPI